MPDRLKDVKDDHTRFEIVVGSIVDAERKADARFAELREAIAAAAHKAEEAAKEAVSVRTDLGTKIDVIGANVSKLASARLVQQAFTSLVLGGALSVLIKVVTG